MMCVEEEEEEDFTSHHTRDLDLFDRFHALIYKHTHTQNQQQSP